ncbi:MAG TPA: hypothetical protein VJU77_19020 [Chthoniobacterales bacterium]|nr:hypothetical protein [Chthoniobacterales bacterium]
MERLLAVAHAEELQVKGLHESVRRLCDAISRQDWETAAAMAIVVSSALPSANAVTPLAENCGDLAAPAFLES